VEFRGGCRGFVFGISELRRRPKCCSVRWRKGFFPFRRG
jgi:hypothetical protein